MDLGQRENLDSFWIQHPEFHQALIARTLPSSGPVSVKIFRDSEEFFTLWFEYAGLPIMIANGCPLHVGQQVEITFPEMRLNQILIPTGKVLLARGGGT